MLQGGVYEKAPSSAAGYAAIVDGFFGVSTDFHRTPL
jgi:hypothetical protein